MTNEASTTTENLVNKAAFAAGVIPAPEQDASKTKKATKKVTKPAAKKEAKPASKKASKAAAPKKDAKEKDKPEEKAPEAVVVASPIAGGASGHDGPPKEEGKPAVPEAAAQ